jgi:hypothetical protein
MLSPHVYTMCCAVLLRLLPTFSPNITFTAYSFLGERAWRYTVPFRVMMFKSLLYLLDVKPVHKSDDWPAGLTTLGSRK